MTTEKKLIQEIMDIWSNMIATPVGDRKVNNLIDNFALSIGIDETKLEGDVYLTVRNMTNSQKRKLCKKLSALTNK